MTLAEPLTQRNLRCSLPYSHLAPESLPPFPSDIYVYTDTMARYLDFITTDVFTAQPFSGNPLAIVFLPKASDFILSQAQKQLIAREFNLSETVFLHDRADSPGGERRIDIFVTDAELPFAGHPTIGSASFLLSAAAATKEEPPKAIITKSGKIPISPVSEAPLRFNVPAVAASIAHDTHIHQKRFSGAELLKIHPTLEPYISAEAQFPVFSIVNGMSQVFVQLPSLEALAAVTTSAISVPADEKHLDEGWASGLVCPYFFVSGVRDEVLGREVIRARMIAGALEDPATGSAASGLAAYLTLQEGGEGVHRYDVVQGVEMGRRSEIGVDVRLGAGGKIEAVGLVGSAVEISSGRVAVPP